jgi:hypothetical protein
VGSKELEHGVKHVAGGHENRGGLAHAATGRFQNEVGSAQYCLTGLGPNPMSKRNSNYSNDSNFQNMKLVLPDFKNFPNFVSG